MRNILYILILIFSIGTLMLQSSCNKKKPMKGVVLVVDKYGAPVAGADVLIEEGDIYDVQVTTGSDGRYEEEYELPAILSIDVQKIYTNIGGTGVDSIFYGSGILRLQEEETVEVIIELLNGEEYTGN